MYPFLNKHTKWCSYFILIFGSFSFIHDEIALFLNCELLINIVLFCLFLFIFMMLNIYNFRNIFIYYPMILRRDFLLNHSIFTYICTYNNLFIQRCRIICIYLISNVFIFIYTSLLYKFTQIYNIILIHISTYIESRLLFIILYNIQLILLYFKIIILIYNIYCYLQNNIFNYSRKLEIV